MFITRESLSSRTVERDGGKEAEAMTECLMYKMSPFLFAIVKRCISSRL